MAEKITRKPSTKVYSLTAPARVNGTWGWRSSCKVPASAKDDKKNDRATYIEEEWELGMGLNTQNKNGTWNLRNPRLTSKPGINYDGDFTCWLNAGKNWSNGWKNVTRQTFYPVTKHKLFNIHLRMRLCNAKGRGAAAYVYRALEFPATPSMTNLSQNLENGRVTATVKFDKGWNNNKEAYDCCYKITYLDTSVSKTPTVKTGTRYVTEFTLAYDAVNRMKLTYDQYIQVTYEVWARGLRGDSPHVKKSLVVSYPAKATIYGVDVPTTASTGKVTVRLGTNQNTQHPVTGCRLQVLKDTNYKKKTDIPASEVAGWEDTDIIDNGTCNALATSVEDLKPTAGKTTWVRVKTWNQSEEIFYRYSEPVRITKLETPAQTAADDEIKIISATPGADGESAVVLLGWNDTGTSATGSEVSWSENENAWRSTDAPSTFDVTWNDGAQTIEGKSYQGTATVYIQGLKKDTLYFIRARRYMEGETTTYSRYSDASTILPTTTPNSVTLLVPEFIARGKPLPLTWTYDSDSAQTSWEIISGETVVDEGKDAIGSCVISAERVQSLVGTNTSLLVQVRMSTGGDYVTSDVREVRIADAPTLSLSVPSTITAQAPSIAIESNTASNIALVITAQGMQSAYPDGTKTQTAGDTVYSDVFAPSWIDFIVFDEAPASGSTVQVVYQSTDESLAEQREQGKDYAVVTESFSGDGTTTRFDFEHSVSQIVSVTPAVEYQLNAGTRNATFTLPNELDFWQGASYTFRATATDPQTQLTSEAVEYISKIEWAHEAPQPSENIVLTPEDTADEDDMRTRHVVIQLAAPTGALETDVYDVYRVTPDRAYLIAVDVALDAQIDDPFAPYGGTEKAYRIACRTADGDVNWLDYDYELGGNDLRIDFGSQYIELPYNLVLSDSYAKDFESREHLGADTPAGYWNNSVSRKASLATDVFKIREQDKQSTIRDLARYTAPCFVRTPNGCAYEANVDVSGIDFSHNTAFSAIALDATEVGLTQDFMAIVPLPETDPDETPETPEGE